MEAPQALTATTNEIKKSADFKIQRMHKNPLYSLFLQATMIQ